MTAISGHRRRRLYRQSRQQGAGRSGLTPVCYDTLEKGHEWAVRWGPLERATSAMPRASTRSFARHKPRAIIHMAGYAEVGESVRQPERYMHNNVTKTGVLVEAALRHGIEAFVFSSSCSVYGLPQSDLLDEKHPIAPMSPYAESKARAESSSRLPQRAGCARLRCAISMPRVPTPGAISAKRTRRKPICCRLRPMPRSASVRRSPCSATTIRRPMAPACATMST